MDYQSEIQALARQYNAKVTIYSDMPPEAASSDLDGLNVAPITNELGFFVALHELGHIAHGDPAKTYAWADKHPDKALLAEIEGKMACNVMPHAVIQTEEAKAMQFALEHHPNPSPAVAANAAKALGSYQWRGWPRSKWPQVYTDTLGKLKQLAAS